MSAYSVNDKVALVTGAARGIGFETARLLCERGARVVLLDLDPDATAQAARRLGGRAVGLGADVTNASAMQDAVAETPQARASRGSTPSSPSSHSVSSDVSSPIA